jgi:2-polyprenyl-3-methyl-5-hydroxy-6-metoxy-1,4-benzoquinol methylase
MKLLQLHTLYDPYIQQFYRRNPRLLLECFEKQNNAVLQDGYGAVHMVTPVLNRMGYEASVVFGNCLYSQARWLDENQKKIDDTRNWTRDIVRVQMETIRPDIVYATDSETFDSHFFEGVAWKPRVTIGWRGAPAAPGTDWSSFDVMLSHLTLCRDRAKQLGARSTRFFFPGFPSFIAVAVQNEQKRYDVVFTGQWTAAHKERNALLHALALEAEKKRFSLGLFLSAKEDVPPLIKKYNQGAQWGMDMYRVLRAGRIVINAEADFAGGEGGNMRLFETTGVGSFLLTQHLSNIDRYFMPGCEIETYANAGEMIEKIAFYLDHAEERNRIAHKGQDRCFKEYSLEQRVHELNGIIQSCLDGRKVEPDRRHTDVSGVSTSVQSSQEAAFQSTGPPISSAAIIESIQAVPSKRTAPENEPALASPLTGKPNVTLRKTIRPEALAQSYRQQYDIDTDQYFSEVAEIKEYECNDTGYRFFYPFHISGDSAFYEQLEKMPWYYMDWKYEHEVALRFIRPGQTILEIGCANGSFLEVLRTRGIIGVGLEYNEKAIGTAQSKQLEVHRHTLQEHATHYPRRYDAVCAFQVIEHIGDVSAFIESSLAVLKPGGVVIFSVPNHSAFMGMDDRNILDMPPHHMGMWNETSLNSIATIFDLSLVELNNEPLQPYHFDYYASLAKRQFPTDIELQAALINYAHIHPERIKGFTAVAVFERSSSTSSKSEVSGGEPAKLPSNHSNSNAHAGAAGWNPSLLRSGPTHFDKAVACIKQSKISEALSLLSEELRANPANDRANALFAFIQSPEDRSTATRYHIDQNANPLRPETASTCCPEKAGRRNHQHTFLNLGCGAHYHPDWLNVDFKSTHPSIVEHDLNKGIPFDNSTFNVVYHSHLLEHFPKHFAPDFLKECHRVLKPGGILRVVVPDLEQIARWYLLLLDRSLQGDLEAQRRYEWIMLEMFDQMVRNQSGGEMLAYWRQNPMPSEEFVIERMGAEVKGMLHTLRQQPFGAAALLRKNQLGSEQIGQFRRSGEIHHWMYDRYSLGKLLSDAGFCKIGVCRADESAIPGFNDFHLDLLPDGSVRKPDSLFMEAHK